MFNLQFSPYCADYQAQTLNTTTGELTTWPRRPIFELTRSRLKNMLPASVFVVAIALYENYDANLYDYRLWLEKMLGYSLTLKMQPSRKYVELYDGLLIPCRGPQVKLLERGR